MFRGLLLCTEAENRVCDSGSYATSELADIMCNYLSYHYEEENGNGK